MYSKITYTTYTPQPRNVKVRDKLVHTILCTTNRKYATMQQSPGFLLAVAIFTDTTSFTFSVPHNIDCTAALNVFGSCVTMLLASIELPHSHSNFHI